MNTVKRYSNITDLCIGFTDFLQKIAEGKERINLCLSGGQTPKSIFQYWSLYCKNTLPWNKIYFYWGDERCVTPEDEMSNFGMTKTFLFDKLHIPEQQIFRIYGENIPENEAKRYAGIIPDFDLVMLGMGEDGHTVSIFPDQISSWDAADKCIVTSHPGTNTKRISISGEVINSARNVAFLITGKNKAEKVTEILHNREQYINTYPAARVNPKSGNLFWFLEGI